MVLSTWKRSATSMYVAPPASQAATIRSRRSIDKAISLSRQHPSHHSGFNCSNFGYRCQKVFG